MKVVLAPGEALDVEFAETDGMITVVHGPKALEVYADLPDDTGRVDEIYSARIVEEDSAEVTMVHPWQAIACEKLHG